MTCWKCGLDVAMDMFICRCGWRRTITSGGRTSIVVPGITERYKWEMIPDGCLLVVGEIAEEDE